MFRIAGNLPSCPLYALIVSSLGKFVLPWPLLYAIIYMRGIMRGGVMFVCVCACVRACVWRRRQVSEWVPARVTPSKGEWPIVVRPLLSLKMRPHSKIRKNLEKKNLVMDPDCTRNKELLCWRGPAAIQPAVCPTVIIKDESRLRGLKQCVLTLETVWR
jgi:hypothetical protein